MKLSDAVRDYVERKNAAGHDFEKGAANLAALRRDLGDISLDEVETTQISAYLDSRPISVVTWRLKYYILLRFFEFWSSRGEMGDLIMPPLKARVRQTFVPYIYSVAEVRQLLEATGKDRSSLRIDQQTMRSLLILLYGTGALVGEVIRLRLEDVDLREGMLTLRNPSGRRSRHIPICPDLKLVLRRYVRWREGKREVGVNRFFINGAGHAILARNLGNAFERLRRTAGLCRHDGATYQPRLHDLKYTFAVQRITFWIRNKVDLNRMLPALAAYMGQVGLGSTERYLAMTPERFRSELDMLSPAQGKTPWREDRSLMELVGGL